jgi:predicted nicotinamide N-methyase
MYVVEKHYGFETEDGHHVKAFTRELFTSDTLSVFTWPSALVLSSFIASNRFLVNNKTCLEIGSGNGLPSVVAGLLGAELCVLTERKDQPITIENLKFICEANGLSSRSFVVNGPSHIC